MTSWGTRDGPPKPPDARTRPGEPGARLRNAIRSVTATDRGGVALRDRVAVAIATVFGAGRAPVAPGTAGSAVTVLLLWLVPFSFAGLVAFLVGVVVVGTWAAHHAERVIGRKDPGAIVVDEVAGMTLTVIAFPLTPWLLFAGFLLFRLFDIVKPPPARASQRIRGGVGVMIDDLIAGVWALGVLAIGRALLGSW